MIQCELESGRQIRRESQNRCSLHSDMTENPGGHSNVNGGIRLVQKFMKLGLFFRTRQCTRVHRLWVQKRAKLEKGGFCHIDKFWKGHDGQIKKNAYKNAYLGYIFIPEKYVIRVLFVSPWTSLIPPLAIRVPPGLRINFPIDPYNFCCKFKPNFSTCI